MGEPRSIAGVKERTDRGYNKTVSDRPNEFSRNSAFFFYPFHTRTVSFSVVAISWFRSDQFA